MTEVGEQLPERKYHVTRADLVRYAGASGDTNPIHWSDRIAAAAGLPGVIAHGMLTMALAGRSLTEWTGDPGAIVEYGVRFARPVVVPDDDAGLVLTVSGVVTEMRDDGRVGVELTALVGDEKVLTQARAVVRGPIE
ncbi:MAG TPA: MaoC family dehydratase [Jiangellaceae bacterium]